MAELVFDMGKVINYKNAGEEIAYRDVVPIGTSCIGISNMPIPQNEVGTVTLEGIWELPADTSTTFEVGDMLYWNTAGKKLTKTSTDIPAGMCTLKKESATAVGQVKLLGNAVKTGE